MRADNLRVERAAVAATELSLSRCAELYTAVPVVDHGADLLVYQVEPFRVAQIQVKGTTRGLKVFRQYSQSPMIVSYVLDPLGAAEVFLLTGGQAWNLPDKYIASGGRAGDHHPDNATYNWPSRTRLLSSMLAQHRATPQRWLDVFEQTVTPAIP
ncbi:hypothetical protein [Prauserella endophytica]|uniref:DUF4365 domain-containing protein n=1 Tax=Prauserella endophytica TaxID=1592324 RepID=A0ABY2RT04_9PSEU|nr:hypothetical protein [Prauserella endophytica]TKG59157.1 hypothetical protein FCN18_37130 [Prauserella endophytica]